ncbi:MAG: hypothetical protein WCJ61_12135 [Paludibacter sp.]
MNTIKKYILLVMFITFGFGLQAQNSLKIRDIFDDYSNSKGVTMVQLTNETMDGFDFTLYKSISIKNNPELVELLQKYLLEDQKQADKVKKMESGRGDISKNTTFLILPKRNQLFRLILYKNESLNMSDQTTLLIYIETKSKPDDMLNFILKKK